MKEKTKDAVYGIGYGIVLGSGLLLIGWLAWIVVS
jgi:hypothetical protein